jgi:hypothetical protein
MKLLAVYSAKYHLSGNIDMQIRAEIDGVQVDIPFSYRAGDPNGLGAALQEWWAVNPSFPIAAADPPADPAIYDQANLNAALAEEGSVFRAMALLTLQEINALRVRAGLTAYTMTQFVTALKAKMRT